MAMDVARGVASSRPNGRADSRDSDALAAALLGRAIFDVGEAGFAHYLDGATVLVTGAAGSVGSELCMRLARLGAAKLVLVDQAEASLVDLVRALEHEGYAHAVPVLADVTVAPRAAAVVEQHRPDVVFHAAAYKQVTLLEANPVEAVATNIFGTASMIDAARRLGVRRFVLFSTDKAVAPTSILGQTKCVAEWLLAATARDTPDARYGAVRLGNVADSAGSILPILRRQIARGGPVVVTHPRATRYMMTLGEAARLAVVAGALADSRSIFWVDLRPAVRVLDLVARLAEGAARDVAIEFIGLRPGERLHEQLVLDGDVVEATPCKGVFRSPLRVVDRDWLGGWMEELFEHVEFASADDVRTALAAMHTEAHAGAASIGSAPAE